MHNFSLNIKMYDTLADVWLLISDKYWLQKVLDKTKKIEHAVAQQLDTGFPLWRPGFAYGQHVGFVVDKAALGQVFSEYFSFPCQSFHGFLHYHITQG
jgi:hypothetical protein